MNRIKNDLGKVSALALSIVLLAQEAHAGGGGMPWEGPIQQIIDSVSGPVAKAVGVGAIIVTGLSLAFGEGGSGMKKLLWVVFGISIAFAASSFFLSFFGFGGGALI